MTLKDHIKQLVGEEEFNNVLSEVKENISVETKNFRNTKYISNGCLIIGFLCLFFPPFLDRGGNIARHWYGYTYDKSRCPKEIGYIQRGVVFLDGRA
ncbi:hypothetical protein [Acinetobacter baumannii]|uniref:hypothetical protein n=1 Tax=Acinetobacter baumannii TaxID=470 RepID=UPI001BC86F76|nr:hypothetical protein [Acinetobacter baumannii]